MLHKIDLGLIPYQEALNQQLSFVEKVRENPSEEFVIFCSHPPVVTLGKKATESDLQGWNGEVVSVKRGGKATYHGPNQIVVYPIISLKHRANDVYRVVRDLENSVVDLLQNWNVPAEGDPQNTGVWSQGKKLASIGLAVTHWTTYHGMAINLAKDPNAFQGIRPCGMSPSIMTSLEEIVPVLPPKDVIIDELWNNLSKRLNQSITTMPIDTVNSADKMTEQGENYATH